MSGTLPVALVDKAVAATLLTALPAAPPRSSVFQTGLGGPDSPPQESPISALLPWPAAGLHESIRHTASV